MLPIRNVSSDRQGFLVHRVGVRRSNLVVLLLAPLRRGSVRRNLHQSIYQSQIVGFLTGQRLTREQDLVDSARRDARIVLQQPRTTHAGRYSQFRKRKSQYRVR